MDAGFWGVIAFIVVMAVALVVFLVFVTSAGRK